MEIIKLNLIPSGVNPVCHCSQYDAGRIIRFELFDGLTPYTLSSEDEITLKVRKPDNTIVTAEVENTEDNYIDIVTTEQMTACFGNNLGELNITTGEKVIGSLNFVMVIEKDPIANGDPSQSVIKDLDALVQEAVEADLGDDYYTKLEVDNKITALIDDTLTSNNKAWSSQKINEEIESTIKNVKFVSLEKQYSPAVLTNDGYVVQTGASAEGFSVSEAKSIDKTARYIIIPYDFTPKNVNIHCVINFYTGTTLGTFVSGIVGATTKGLKVEIPSNANYFRITCPDSETNWGIEYQYNSEIDYITDRIYSKGAYTLKGNMTAGSAFEIPQTNCKDNQVYSFTAISDDFSNLNLIIGHGKTAYESCYITITPTNCDFTRYTSSATTESHTHGLTFSQFINVKIVVKAHGVANITIQTADNNGDYEYSLDVTNWTGCSGDANNEVFTFAELVSGSLSDCVFSWSCSDFRKQLWAFGDSYFAYFNTRWLYYLDQDGFYDNILVNGQSGENSAKALIAFKNMLEYFGKPKYILWCMGQNDGSDTTVSNYNNWLDKITEVINICKANDITPILCTIPSVPKNNGRSHELKNSWIRSSGNRFVDMAAAVGAKWNNGAVTWYPNMLASDDEHPDTEGGKAIEKRMLLDCPELTFKS